ncbi:MULTISPECIES: inositol monophosphatase family protein [Deefgea]|uniref:Inositol-1-monophosphatase n=1 Tax=Deefgea chitinilytica TaxID=570276 RepID=A0ABS2C8H1_9NEIS|nr:MULTISPECIES: inositol monophosphatase family protein [Deefgea]MBM5570357.1 inositol monophosphatase [Deefgea chitinilytica]MBM9887586.1 inositol monophosphatase [Deefgea sp. CFH1-16]
MHPMLNTAVRAARRAATVIQRASNNLDLITPEKKGHNDFVTEVDRAAEQAIIETILEAYPNHAILAEESGKRGNSDYVWIIDPLDGTTNFLHGFPQYAISIALEHKGVITQAVVYDPNRNDLFTATRGVGAFLNDRRIRVSKVRELSDALVGTGFPYTKFNNLENYLNIFRDMAQKAAGVRRPGAAALDLAYVACGRFDGFFEFDLKLVDIAAGTLLVQEAGGLVTDLNGEEKFLESGDVLCGTPRVFGQMLSVIRGHLK